MVYEGVFSGIVSWLLLWSESRERAMVGGKHGQANPDFPIVPGYVFAPWAWGKEIPCTKTGRQRCSVTKAELTVAPGVI